MSYTVCDGYTESKSRWRKHFLFSLTYFPIHFVSCRHHDAEHSDGLDEDEVMCECLDHVFLPQFLFTADGVEGEQAEAVTQHTET